MSEPLFQYFVQESAKAHGVVVKPPRDGDAGFDLPCSEKVTIEPGKRALVPTGVHMAIPQGWVGILRDRSSVASKMGCVTAAGVIDAGYRGEVKVLMYNLSDSPVFFELGDRIAQCVVLPHLSGIAASEVPEFEALGNTERGQGGFGSTGS